MRMLAAWCGAKRGASSIHTMPEGSVMASTLSGSGWRQALAGASRRMSTVVRACGTDAAGGGGGGGAHRGGGGRCGSRGGRRRGLREGDGRAGGKERRGNGVTDKSEGQGHG